MIDARRMEVYTALYDQQFNAVLPVDAVIVENETFRPFEGKTLALFGSGAEKCRELLSGSPNLVFPGSILPSAAAVASLAAKKFRLAEFVNTAYFEPFYLKDFIAGKPNVKGLRS
jgi:tRNA threonylcarbamoyladenosine biosynthesis protein TsaB